MDSSSGDRTAVQALRLGLPAQDVIHLRIPVSVEAEILVLQAAAGPAPLILCLHPGRLCEFQCAQRLRDLVHLGAHIAFPRGPHAQEVNLGGARTVGYGWYHYTGDNPAFRRSLEAAAEYLERVLARLLERLRVRREAIFVIGAEDTSLLAAVLALRQPELISAAILFDGVLPSEVLADCVAASGRPEFLRVRRSMRWPEGASPGDQGTEQLRPLGCRVDLEFLETRNTRWHVESELLLNWFAERLGLTIESEAARRAAWPAPPPDA
jgi:predicted esterase